MNDSRETRYRNRDKILQQYPERAIGVRFARSTGSTSKGVHGIAIFIMLLFAMIFFIMGIYFWNYTEYSSINIQGTLFEIPYCPYRYLAIPSWIVAIVFAIIGNILYLIRK